MYLSQDSLRTLAEETGGYAAVNSNNVTTALNRIVRLNSTYYVLGYYPKDARRDGRFHKIEVRVKRPGFAFGAKRLRLAEDHQRRGTGEAGARTRPWPRTRRLGADLERTAGDPESAASAEWPDADRAPAPFKGAAREASVALASRLTPPASTSPSSPTRRLPTESSCACSHSTSGAGSMAAAFTSSIWRCGRTPTSACAARSCA